ncbi:deoxyuridine 5'-triphosphate nucleotidohydrolase-like [Adelges cooleyi]|uniref:deoxyuridine 5'-triphosphate nucleotidohydrolase-like n=1 Tax=Adelges cooleyi TaxID=133065 RepID=UPI00218066E6|nr:deoxyuridine 5'-triphosphate nucleotidohydrolase-like [Adelges cooleyi]
MPSPVKKVKLDSTLCSDSVLAFAKLTEHAYPPTKGSQLAAGYDLRSAYAYTIKAHGKELVKTDIQIKVPHGTYGRIAPRSGLAWKNFIDVGAGVIDEDYRGNVGIVLFNHSDDEFTIQPGDRVAQLVCEKIAYPEIRELKSLDETERGEGGFGSTGTQ